MPAFGALLLLLGAVGGANISGEESIDEPPPPFTRPVQVAAASGAVFGLVYWLLAGRNAGRWRERLPSPRVRGEGGERSELDEGAHPRV